MMKLSAAFAAILAATSNGQAPSCLLIGYQCSTDPKVVGCCSSLYCDSDTLKCKKSSDMK